MKGQQARSAFALIGDVTSEQQAREVHAELMRRAALGGQSAARQAQNAEALAALEERFPDLAAKPSSQEPPTDTDATDRRPSGNPSDPRGGHAAVPAPRTRKQQPAGRGDRGRRSGPARAAGRVQAGAVRPYATTGAIVLGVLGATLATVIFYNLIIAGEGPSNGLLDKLSTGFTTGLRVFLQPVDPLAAGAAKTATTPATGGALAGVTGSASASRSKAGQTRRATTPATSRHPGLNLN